MQAKLQAISFHHCIMHQNILSQIKSHRGFITRIELHHAVREFDDDVFAEFLQSLPCLRDLTLGNESTTATIDSLFKITADTLAPRLEMLCLPYLTGSVEPEGFSQVDGQLQIAETFLPLQHKREQTSRTTVWETTGTSSPRQPSDMSRCRLPHSRTYRADFAVHICSICKTTTSTLEARFRNHDLCSTPHFH